MSFVTFSSLFFFFNDTATTEIYTLSLHDALPILRASTRRVTPARCAGRRRGPATRPRAATGRARAVRPTPSSRQAPCAARPRASARSEEHTSELQSRSDLVCRLLLEKKKKEHRRTVLQEPDYAIDANLDEPRITSLVCTKELSLLPQALVYVYDG